MAAYLRGEVERTVLEPAGVSWTTYAALTAITDGPHPIRMHVVADAMGTPLGTTRSAVTRLERLGLISRSTPSRDHRQVELAATEPGLQRAEQLRSAVAVVEARLIPDPRTRHVLYVVANRVRPYPRRGHRQGRGA
ncbi:MarR family winged helix-turn-helix transcriptional regulator [Dactylosporangium sp. CA-139066]|uniref:MarR family winged helix-turn-helix transcriptional regulator n=1 Tax=Dactylosporangium sp. CA-139066 TaxID=3239930 RepID=UPI003D8FDF48